MMKLLLIGGGGREHALAWKLAQSPRVTEVIVAPGNAGTALEPGLRNVAVDVRDVAALLAIAQAEQVGLTVVGPEVPLVAGVVDAFQAAGLRIFGPSAAAAQLEGSKAFAKEFLRRHAIPTAAYAVFTELDPALAWVRAQGAPIVVKADGLAAGKGVVVAMDLAEAEHAVRDMLGGGSLGNAGARVVIEEFMAGEEASYIVMCDGVHALPMATSQDHKRRDDGDRGPNTGGMGAYSPAPVVTSTVDARVMREIIRPTLAGMAADGMPFTGFLYAGLMIDAAGAPRVVEFNVRFGDPETQPVMLRLRSDLVALIEAALDGRLDTVHAEWDPRPALAVVLAAGGYPGTPRSGDALHGLDAPLAADCKLFHAGTRLVQGHAYSAGGRVLSACALGEDIAQARERAYATLAPIRLEGGFYRHDIGHRALQRG
jgi:phosphoribosylamine--glycine ligase